MAEPTTIDEAKEAEGLEKIRDLCRRQTQESDDSRLAALLIGVIRYIGRDYILGLIDSEDPIARIGEAQTLDRCKALHWSRTQDRHDMNRFYAAGCYALLLLVATDPHSVIILRQLLAHMTDEEFDGASGPSVADEEANDV